LPKTGVLKVARNSIVLYFARPGAAELGVLMRRREFLAGVAVAAFHLMVAPASAAAPKPDPSVNALVIGISYSRAPANFRLDNTVADATVVADFLRSAPGRRVSFVRNPNVQELRNSVNNYLNGLRKTDIAFIYYAGHGVQINGANYILSDDASALIAIAEVVVQARQRARMVLLFLDACRNNPFARQNIATATGRSIQLFSSEGVGADLDTRAVGQAKITAIPLDSASLRSTKGLAQFQLQGRGVKVIFATDPGNVAYDGVGSSGNSPFTRSLVKALSQPKALDEVLADVTKDVVALTHGEQTPWVQGSLEETVFISGKPSRFDTGVRAIPIP
jgi:uncharacterized caspase-like protein